MNQPYYLFFSSTNSAFGHSLSPDMAVCGAKSDIQNPENSQNYNRYAYCLNNPMKYTDPSGYLTWAQRECMNYAWGYSFINGGNNIWFSRWDLMDIDIKDKDSWTYLSNCKSTINGIVKTLNDNERTNIWAGTDLQGSHITTEAPHFGINKDASGSLGGFYLSPDISSFTQFDLDDVMSFMMGKNKSSIAYFSTSAAYIYTEQNTKPLIMNTLVGQHVVIELENMNKTGVELEVSIYNSSESKAKSSKSNSRSLFDTTFNLLPNAKKSFDFYQFKPAPFNLNINLQTTISSFTNVNCKIFSTWVPGMPYDPQSDYIPK